MGNCLLLSKCRWPLALQKDAEYEFDPEKDITIEPQKGPDLQ